MTYLRGYFTYNSCVTSDCIYKTNTQSGLVQLYAKHSIEFFLAFLNLF